MLNTLNSKKNFIFWQIIILALFFILTILSLFWFLLPKASFMVDTVVRSTVKNSTAYCDCLTQQTWLAKPPVAFSGLLFLVLALIWLVFLLSRIIIVKMATAKFLKFILQQQQPLLSEKLKLLIVELGLVNKVVELDCPQPLVFCFGFWRPMIGLNSKLVVNLSMIELAAVLKHEKEHLIANEPFKLFILKIIVSTFFFVPGLKLLIKQYEIISELGADAEATKNWQDKKPLIQALVKVFKLQEKFIFSGHNLALSFLTTTMGERMNKLIDINYLPKIRVWSPQLAGVLVLLVLILSGGVLVNKNNLTKLNVGSHICHNNLVEQQQFCSQSNNEWQCQLEYKLDLDLCQS